jgi:predicted  nucleic acid-binding Zn-ribbon protein
VSSSARRASALAVHLAAARDEVERLREEVVRLQAKVEELEAAELARQESTLRRGLASLIPGGSPRAV